MLMASVGPFEIRPGIAVACSGGADSMTLALLTEAWAAKRGGRVTALVIDHSIRENSKAEAQSVAAELASHGVACQIILNNVPIRSADVQATARKIRYELLNKWCVANGYLHLAVAHHQEDQAETVLLRLARGSGSHGLAAMAPVVETSKIRIIRPILSVPQTRLQATLAHLKVKHVHDLSNDDKRFARVRIRGLSLALAAEGMTARRLSETASRMARTRDALEQNVAEALARMAVVYPSGYCCVSQAPLRAIPEEVALRVMARLLMCIGGNSYSPRLARLERLLTWIQDGAAGSGRTLAGCRVLRRCDGLLICREASAVKSVLPARGELLWDGRFKLCLGNRNIGEVRRLGSNGWQQAIEVAPRLRQSSIPAVARATLPSIWKGDALSSVPHLGLLGKRMVPALHHPHQVVFAPPHPLVPARFTLQKGRFTLSTLM